MVEGGLDDGFDDVVPDVVVSEAPNRKKRTPRKKTRTPRKLFNGDGEDEVANSFMTPELDALHIIEDEYLIDELDSASGSDSETDPKPKVIRFKEEELTKQFKFMVGMEFSSLKQFKDAVLEHNVLNGREVKFAKNDKVSVRVVCKFKETCRYTILVSRVIRSTTYVVKTLHAQHTCGRVFHNKSAKSNWVAKVIVDRMKNTEKLKLNELMADVRTRFSTEITPSRAFKARQIAKKIVEGDLSKQYSLLWSYSAELRRASAGNTCKLVLERPAPNLQPRFGRYYLCFDGCKRALEGACRPFIGLDGCHLKNKYGGQLFIVVGRDPNDQYLPLAFAVMETKTKDSWSWFLYLLLEDIGDATTNRWTFISDQQKGLVQVFQEKLGGTEHRFCLRHLYANLKKKFGGGTQIRDLIMAAAKATYYEAWEEKMLELKQVNADAYEWLKAVPMNAWCKHAFPFYSRCDVLMNNLSESFNATILLQRDKLIITMFEWIRTYLIGRFASLREKVRKHGGLVMPKPRKRLDREIEMSGNWFATFAGGVKFEVTHSTISEKFVVDLEKHSCTCNFWELVGIPCRHAVSAINMKQDDPTRYVHRYYNRESYILCYDETISPINGQKRWPTTDYVDILPPDYKRGPGRPKKLRRREPDEPSNSTKWMRTHTTHRCKKCHKYGHNTRTCKNPAVPGYVQPQQSVGATQTATQTTVDGEQPQTESVGATQTAAPKKRGRPKGRAQPLADATQEEGPTQASQTESTAIKRGRPKGKAQPPADATQEGLTQASQIESAPIKRGRPKGKTVASTREPSSKKTKRIGKCNRAEKEGKQNDAEKEGNQTKAEKEGNTEHVEKQNEENTDLDIEDPDLLASILFGDECRLLDQSPKGMTTSIEPITVWSTLNKFVQAASNTPKKSPNRTIQLLMEALSPKKSAKGDEDPPTST